MGLLIREIHGNIAAYGVQLLSGGHILLEEHVTPTEAEDRLRACVPGLLHRGGKDLRQELVRAILPADDRSYGLDGKAGGIMGVAVAAGGHYEALSGIVQNLRFALLNKCRGSRLVAHIDVFAVLHSKCFRHLAVFGSEYFPVDHEVGGGTFGRACLRR